jgi:hypothetical protein
VSLPWAEGADYCGAAAAGSSAGALATFRHEAEAAFVADGQCGGLAGAYWIGLSDANDEAGCSRASGWAWASADADTAHLYSLAGRSPGWPDGEPDNFGGGEDWRSRAGGCRKGRTTCPG